MRTLQELLEGFSGLGRREAIRYFDGYRTHVWSYRRLLDRVHAVASELDSRNIEKGDRILIWSENRPEWVALFWACLARGIEVVPVDSRSSADFVARILGELPIRLVAHGHNNVEPLSGNFFPLDQVERLRAAPCLKSIEATPEDVVEIVFTSGTTGDPKGVVHRHRNICANLRPFVDEIRRYRRMARPFQPIRILDLLPLSHMFGQSLALFIPIILEGAVAFSDSLNPAAVLETLRRERISVLVGVPRMLENLRDEIVARFAPSPPWPHASGIRGILQRWWRYRRIHRATGWKFWALTVGGAEVPLPLERVFGEWGYVVIQGYGLTETSPVVAVNHPFRNQPGSLGGILPGQEVRLAEDGEILVRGDAVVSDFVGRQGEDSPVDEQGWLRTGDLGEMDDQGRLYYRGRKKDLIVTPEGLNVHPRDVEAALNRLEGVGEAVAVPLRGTRGEEVHAVLLLERSDIEVHGLIRAANAGLEAHQRIKSWSLWPERDFPRTDSTFKVKRRLVAEWAAARTQASQVDGHGALDPVDSILSGLTGQAPSALTSSLRLAEDLGLSSLDRIELLSGLEQAYILELDEERFAALTTVGELKELLGETRVRRRSTSSSRIGPIPAGSGKGESRARPLPPPDRRRFFWQRRPVTWFRAALLEGLILPLSRIALRLEVVGRENLSALRGPVILVANHASHLDVPALFLALPFRLRHRVSPAMRQEYFMPMWRPREFGWRRRMTARFHYFLAAGCFAAYPLPQKMGGVRNTLRFTGRLVDAGRCPLVFPEGRRSDDGRMGHFHPGAALMAMRLGIPVLPIHLEGLFRIYSKHHRYPAPGKAVARIGSPIDLSDLEDPIVAMARIEEAVRTLGMLPPSGEKIA